jgi:predicted nucleic acid-binding protein
MQVVIDTSALIAVLTNERHKRQLIAITEGAELLAPSSLHWEIGNAFSAMFKQQRISLDEAVEAVKIYQQVPIRFSDIELEAALELSDRLSIYAYDAYVIGCALKHRARLLSLDQKMLAAARQVGVLVEEVEL